MNAAAAGNFHGDEHSVIMLRGRDLALISVGARHGIGANEVSKRAARGRWDVIPPPLGLFGRARLWAP